MPPPWSKPLEIDRLADSAAELDCTVPLAELSGLRALRAGVDGSVHAHAQFTRAAGRPVVALSLRGTATLECQRCLRPLALALESTVRIAPIGSESEAAGVPEELEPVLASGGRISMGELITEELLLSLPIVPLHAAASCAGAAASTQAAPPETHRPFAGLGELMKR
jgi:uncharacterized protein